MTKRKHKKYQVGGAKSSCPPGYYFDFDTQQCVKGEFNVDLQHDSTLDRSYYDPETKTIVLRNNNPETTYHEEYHAEQDRNGQFSPYRSAPMNTAMLALYDKDSDAYINMRYGQREVDVNNVAKDFEKNHKLATGNTYPQDLMFMGDDARKLISDDLQYYIPGTLEYEAENTANKALDGTPPPNNVNFNIMDNKKNNKKFQFAGSNQCGPGTVFDPNTMQCIPIPVDPNAQKGIPLQQGYGSQITGFNQGATTKQNGKLVPSSILPLMNINSMGPFNYVNGQLQNSPKYAFDPKAGATDNRGDFIPQQAVIGDALDKGYNLDSDGVYRKTVTTTDKNQLGFSQGFQALNGALDATSIIAGKINDANQFNQLQDKLQKARYNNSEFNPYEKGVNQVPIYFKMGGSTQEITPNKARQILHDGTINGKKISDKQRKFFGEMSKGNTLNFKPKGKMQNGGSRYTKDQLDKFSNFANSTDSHTINMALSNYGLQNAGNLLDPTVLNNQAGNDITSTRQDWMGMETMRALSNARRLNIAPNAFIANKNTIFSPDGRYGDVVLNNPDFQKMYPNYLQTVNKIYQNQYDNANSNTQLVGNEVAQQYKMGGKIELNPKHKGLFTEEAKHAGMSVQAFAAHVMAHKNKYSSAVVKRAVFAHNFGHKMQDGGNVTNTGYLNDSPDRFNQYNIIPSNSITMDNVDRDIMAYPNNGLPVLLKSNSGTHKFKGSKYVTEVPVKQNGGYVPNYDMPTAYMYNHANPNYPTTAADTSAYTTLFNNVIANPSAFNLNDYQQTTQQTYTQHNESPSDAGKALYMKNAINEAAVRDALQQLKNNPQAKDYGKNSRYLPIRNGFQNGGEIPQVQSNGDGNAELEQGEVFQDHQGSIQKVAENEYTHEDGGSDQPNVNRVLEDTGDKRDDNHSALLRVKPTQAQQIVNFKPKGTVTHSKLFEQASEFYGKKVKGVEKKIEANLNYVKDNGGVYAQNSLDANLKLLSTIPTKASIFDSVYNHQEQVKSMYGIGQDPEYGQSPKQKFGGKPRFDIGGDNGSGPVLTPDDVTPYKGGKTKTGSTTPTGLQNTFTFNGGLDAYKKVWGKAGLDLSAYNTNKDAQSAVYDYVLKNNPTAIASMWKTYGNTKAGINAGLPSTLTDEYLNNPDNLAKLKTGYVDGYFGARTVSPKFMDNVTVPNNPAPAVAQNPSPDQTPAQNNGVQAPKPTTPSTFNEPLHWFDTLGSLAAYTSVDERTPINFEQLNRNPINVHEVNPLPTLEANQSDFNAAISGLPNNGVGYANQANLYANKYKINNEVLGQYENTNKGKYDQVDQINNANQYQTDVSNLQLRDNAQQEQLKSAEAQRQSKLSALNGFLNTYAQNNALNRNGNLVLQMTPYFDQNGQFNGNDYYQQVNNLGGIDIIDKKTGKVIQSITKDANDNVKSSKSTTVQTNK